MSQGTDVHLVQSSEKIFVNPSINAFHTKWLVTETRSEVTSIAVIFVLFHDFNFRRDPEQRDDAWSQSESHLWFYNRIILVFSSLQRAYSFRWNSRCSPLSAWSNDHRLSPLYSWSCFSGYFHDSSGNWRAVDREKNVCFKIFKGWIHDCDPFVDGVYSESFGLIGPSVGNYSFASRYYFLYQFVRRFSTG